MSAFRLGDDAWQNIVDALCHPGPYGNTIEGELKRDYGDILKDWHAANDRAVSYRYSETLEGRCPKLKPSEPIQQAMDGEKFRTQIRPEKSAPLVQYMKTIQCLRYQCSEDVRAEQKEAHEKAMAEMNEALRILGERLVHALPEYEKASWG